LFAAFLGLRRLAHGRDQLGDEAKRTELARIAAENGAIPSLLTRRQKAVVLVVGAVLSAAVLVLSAMKRR
jgi:hypothetical protein